jgi:hypothetical protein
MINFLAIRNPAAEQLGARVEVSVARCDTAGIARAYVGLQGTVTDIDAEHGEVLIHLDETNHKRYLDIESRAFSKSYRDFEDRQWFASGVLKIVPLHSYCLQAWVKRP